MQMRRWIPNRVIRSLADAALFRATRAALPTVVAASALGCSVLAGLPAATAQPAPDPKRVFTSDRPEEIERKKAVIQQATQPDGLPQQDLDFQAPNDNLSYNTRCSLKENFLPSCSISIPRSHKPARSDKRPRYPPSLSACNSSRRSAEVSSGRSAVRRT
jgi:hypothetical protein